MSPWNDFAAADGAPTSGCAWSARPTGARPDQARSGRMGGENLPYRIEGSLSTQSALSARTCVQRSLASSMVGEEVGGMGMRLRYSGPAAVATGLIWLGLSMTGHSPRAWASPAMPPTDYSWYVSTQSTSEINQLGCNQGQFDTTNNVSSLVYIDYGEQNNGNTATESPFQPGVSSAYSTDAFMAAQFALGYFDCSGTRTQLNLVLGTSNCNANNENFGGGQGWGNTVVQANNAVNGSGQFDSGVGQIAISGGSDIESWSGTPQCPVSPLARP